MTKDKGQRTEDRGQRTENGEQRKVERGQRTSPDSISPTVCMGIQLPLLFQAEDVLAVLCEERLEDLISDNFLDTQSVPDWTGPGLASVYSSSS